MFLPSRDLARRYIHKFGSTNQLLKAGEESSEFSAAVHRYHTAVIMNDHDKLMEFRQEMIKELADVLITANQARLIIGEDIIDRKIQEIERGMLKRLEEK